MKIQTLEERVAATPASLICDECVHADVCQWVSDMRKAVVFTKEQCKNAPFRPAGWACRQYLHKCDISESSLTECCCDTTVPKEKWYGREAIENI